MTALRTYLTVLTVALFVLAAHVYTAQAINIGQYSDTLSDSGPGEFINHTFRFRPVVPISPGSYFDIDFPADFEITSATTTFSERNIELYIGGVPRTASTTSGAGFDGVTIIRGAGGSIRYTLGSDVSIPANTSLELRVGNNSSASLGERQVFMGTTTGTTTLPADIEPIRNSNTLGVHEIDLRIVDGVEIADTSFVIFLNEKVSIGPIDTTEEIPPFRFNGSPTSTVGGTTPNVEISLETDELAVCKFDLTASTSFALQSDTFSNTGLIYHSTVVPVTPGATSTFYVRCIDDEGNFNIDDYIIEFFVNETPTGSTNGEGDTGGDGSGTGNGGSGSGNNTGGTSGSGGGDENSEGSESGGGGSGGGGGGGRGGNSGSDAGGGFESTDGPFESGDGRVIISGYAFPGARVTVLVDGQVAEAGNTNSSGRYEITVDEIARGAYTFGVYAEDDDGDRSSTFSTSFTVSGARASRLSNINITPTVAVSPDPAEPGETITFSGYALPDATVTLETSRSDGGGPVTLTAFSNSSGRWETTQDTTGFARGTYRARTSAEQVDGIETGTSDYEFYGIGQEADVPLSPDLNRDGFVNLIDFSILLFWWQTNGGDSDPPADINQDGNVNLTDFSILLFNWTG